MNSREKILKKIKSFPIEKTPMPKFDVKAIASEDRIEAFKQSVKVVGGQAVMLKDYGTIDNLVTVLFPDVKRIATNLEGINCATENPDNFSMASMLNGVDVGIVEGHFGVVENGAVWVTQAMKHKALYFISEALIVILDADQLVETMHEAYKREEVYGDYEYGCFISGPSKTADIEQALVIGAHGAKAVTIVLT
ncbi:L-lactate dehydrogenase complex protein LldG [Balneicella halophila]|uniref:L-lactate dehydrogenase complex protein LldG n=1 Tax=Balneicella halophila TaxID=1537566 RepID=A0A7L4UQV3_BALHA|nr:LUD domain-containing protein [Balneicella halophila]PVX52155.1 L-lactate dehydrogenase complex protein LldG [Balneicella halophila]